MPEVEIDVAAAPAHDGTLVVAKDLTAAFRTKGGIDALVEHCKEQVRLAPPQDVETEAGRKAIIALAYKVVRSKTAIDGAGGSLTIGMRRTIDLIDAGRRYARAELDTLADTVRKPVSDWEAAKVARQAKIRYAIEELYFAGDFQWSSDLIASELARMGAIQLDEATFGDRLEEASRIWTSELARTRMIFTEAEKRERDRAELEALRAKAAADAEEKRLRDEAAAAAAAEDRRKAAEAKRIEEAEAKAAAAAAAAAKAEADKIAADREAERKAAADALAASDRARRDAELRAAQAEAAEKERAARDRAASARAAEAQARMQRRKRTVIDAITKAIEATDREPKSIAKALWDGMIPYCRIAEE